jgi:hypothetical protein
LLSIGRLLTAHVFIGFALVPPTALKVGTTVYRFARYYAGSPAYRRKGPTATDPDDRGGTLGPAQPPRSLQRMDGVTGREHQP